MSQTNLNIGIYAQDEWKASAGRIASYPAIATVGDGFVVAWTGQSNGESTIRAQRLR